MNEGDLFAMSRDARQELGRKRWIENKCRGTFVWPTGTGKTYGAIKCIKSVIDKYPNFKVLVVVPTEPLKTQWQEYFKRFNLVNNCDVQIINTVVKNEWDSTILVCDEIHRYSSNTFSKVFSQVKYNYILGLTATFERLDGKEILISKYCPVIDTITTEEALYNGWISQYKEYAVLLEVDDINVYDEYNREFNKNFEFFGYDFALAMSCLGPNGVTNRLKLRDRLCPNGSKQDKTNTLKAILNYSRGFSRYLQARKKFVNNHPKKIEVARRIIEKRKDKKIVTFSNNVKMAESIGGGEVYTGKVSKKRGANILSDFNNSLPPAILHSCQKLNEGVDIKGLSVAIHLGLDSSKTKAIQKRGRIVRFEQGKQAENFILIIKGTVEEKWLQNSYGNNILKINEEELDKILDGEEIEITQKSMSNLIFRW